jgi:hypothetical protein
LLEFRGPQHQDLSTRERGGVESASRWRLGFIGVRNHARNGSITFRRSDSALCGTFPANALTCGAKDAKKARQSRTNDTATSRQ